MDLLRHLQQMADYNQWSNQNLITACQCLSEQQVAEDRGAFFRSILGSFNHLMVADLLWLRRFAQHPGLNSHSQQVLESLHPFPATTALNQTLYSTMNEMAKARIKLDQLISDWIATLDQETLDQALSYKNSKGIAANRPFGLVLSHFFNHQTHHRGQIGTLLHQVGIDPGITDLLVRIEEV